MISFLIFLAVLLMLLQLRERHDPWLGKGKTRCPYCGGFMEHDKNCTWKE